MQALPAWPYPFWIAHRGAGKLVPENTLAAFRVGAAYGWRMFECDAKLSRDGVPYLMHDATLDRTTNAQGPAIDHDWASLSRLDAGAWHARRWAGEPLPTLENLLRWCIANRLLLNIEIKPIPGHEYDTGKAVAELVARLWPEHLSLPEDSHSHHNSGNHIDGQQAQPHYPPPLLSSFQPESLRGVLEAHPELPRALLLDAWDDTNPQQARQRLQCQALICHYPLWNAQRVQAAHALGLRTLSYTVNDEASADALIALGTDGIITDRVDHFCPASR